MTQDEIIRMAIESGVAKHPCFEKPDVYPKLERFGTLFAANKREKQSEQEPCLRCVELEELCVELEQLCDATYVAQGADAYNHACDEMERWQDKRSVEGKEVGTTHSLCDGIAWLYGYIDKLESTQARQVDLTAEEKFALCTELNLSKRQVDGVLTKYKEKNK